MSRVHVVPPEAAETAQTIDAQLRDARDRRKVLVRSHKAELRAVDRTISRLQAAKQGLVRGKTRGPARVLSAERQAGKKNISAARDALRRLGTASQARVGTEADVGTGSLTWAIRALVERGEAEDTGERENGSRVFRYVPERSRRRTVRPGD